MGDDFLEVMTLVLMVMVVILVVMMLVPWTWIV